jgi:hypothetical protein
MKLVTEYLEQVVYFEGMAEQEADKELKAKLAGAAMAWSLSAVDVGPVIRTAAQNGGDSVKAAATLNIVLTKHAVLVARVNARKRPKRADRI